MLSIDGGGYGLCCVHSQERDRIKDECPGIRIIMFNNYLIS